MRWPRRRFGVRLTQGTALKILPDRFWTRGGAQRLADSRNNMARLLDYDQRYTVVEIHKSRHA